MSKSEMQPMAANPLERIQARHSAWYACDDQSPKDYTGADFGATWEDPLDFVEGYELDHHCTRRQRAMAHEIVRENVPWLIQHVRALEATLGSIAELIAEEESSSANGSVSVKKLRALLDRAKSEQDPKESDASGHR